MKTILGLASFAASVQEVVKGFREKNAANVFAGLLLGMASGACFYLATKEEGLEVHFGPMPDMDEEDY